MQMGGYMTRQTTTIFALLLTFVLSLSCSPVESYGREVPSLTLPALENYVEVTSSDFPDYVKAVASEFFNENVTPIHFYLQQRDLYLLKTLDINKLNSSILICNLKPGTTILTDLLENDTAFNPPLHQIEYTDTSYIAKWIAQDPQKREAIIDFGSVARGRGYVIYAKLGMLAEGISAGIRTDTPTAMVMVLLQVRGEQFAILFFTSVQSADDVSDAAAFVVDYMSRNGSELSKTSSSALAEKHQYFAVLELAAQEWTQLGRWEEAQAAYQRMISFWDATGMEATWKSVELMNRLALVYRGEGKYDQAKSLLSLAIKKAEGLAAPESRVLRQAQLLLAGVLLATDEFDGAKRLLLTLPFEELPLIPRLDAQFMLLRSYVESGESIVAVEYAKEVLPGLHEFTGRQAKTPFFFYLAEAYNNLGKTNTAIFYLFRALTAAAEDVSSGLLDTEEKDAVAKRFAILLNQRKRNDISTKTPVILTRQEITFDSRYGEVAAALRKAGESGTEEAKERARVDFRNWLDEVENTLR